MKAIHHYNTYLSFLRIFFFTVSLIVISKVSIEAKTFYLFQTQEDETWEQIQAENTEEAYMRYTIEYPEGKYIEQAQEQIINLRDDNFWETVLEDNTSASYRRYMKIYPRGRHLAEAKEKLGLNNSPPEESPFTDGGSSTVAENRPRGNENRPSSPPVAEAPTRKPVETEPAPNETVIAEPKPADTEPKPAIDPEEALWSEARKTGTEVSYRNYLTEYPNGKYVNDAIGRVPMELDMLRSNTADSVFVLTIKYAERPVSVKRVELLGDTMRYFPEESPETVSSSELLDGTIIKEYKWGAGRFSADVTPVNPITTEMIITLGTEREYRMYIEDVDGNQREVNLAGGVSALELLGVLGYEPDNDTLFLTIRGGQPEYYARIVDMGQDVNNYLHEEILKPDIYENTWYLAKSNLIKENKIPSGNYDVYVLDSRKLESVKYTRSVTFGTGHLVSNLEFRKFLLIPLGLLILVLVIRWIRKSNSQTRSRYRKFKF